MDWWTEVAVFGKGPVCVCVCVDAAVSMSVIKTGNNVITTEETGAGGERDGL